MEEDTGDATRLLGLEGLRVERVALTPLGVREVRLATDDSAAARCPACGAVAGSVKGWVVTRPKDLPYGPLPMVLRWWKRRWRCRTVECPKQTFTESISQVPQGMRTTTRLRVAVAAAVENGRDASEVACSFEVSWPTVARAVTAHADAELGEPEPTPVLGLDETRFGRARWRPDGTHPDGRTRWRRTDPWETGFVDLAGGQGLLGQIDGRAQAGVTQWLAERTQAFRDSVEYVVIDPHAGYAAGIRTALPHARIAVDHFHLIALANKALTQVRQRITREQLGRRGGKTDPVWANRRLLLRGRERLSQRAMARMWNGCIDNDPTAAILATWIGKEQLRTLCATAARGGMPHEIRTALWEFYDWCATADIPELTTLACTIETWWPAVLTFLQTGLTNAKTEGTNRLVKHVKRAACGFRNRTNYRNRVRLHTSRNQRRDTARPRVPAQH